MFQHRHVKSTRQTVELDDGMPRTIFVVETSLSLKPADPGYDLDAVKELEKAAAEYIQQRPHYAEFRIRNARKE